ncbi:MAG: alpha/beta hydrolase [Lachnospiraceae bacterium]|nr:alpha/beta hydrolase [Lachnospiraceae bacterium]
MKTKKKTVLCVILALLIAADLIISEILFLFALGRPKKVHSDVMPDPVTTEEVQDTVSMNRKALHEKTDAWLESAERERVTIESEDGLLLVGEMFFTDRSSHLWVLAAHGYGYTGTRQAMYDYMLPYAERGYNVLTPDLRAHGESEGRYIGMGWLDRKDLTRWIDQILLEDPAAQIVLHGVSMGGAAVMMTAGEPLPGNVKAVVEDCGYSSVWDMFSDEAKYLFHIPAFPLLYTASFLSGLQAGYTFQEASSLDQIKKVKCPVFFIHGDRDNFVHTDMVMKLYEACPTEKDLFVAEGAGHGDAYYMDPDSYIRAVFSFLDRCGIE